MNKEPKYGEKCPYRNPECPKDYPMPNLEEEIKELDEMVRDFTTVGSRPKSEVRRRIQEAIKSAELRGAKGMVKSDGKDLWGKE